ncbi:MAG: hypothetical protein M1834_003279 [Cirrosporium novae-zelandiae]|nr:MAG: hypothetical protein M1834_003279 [Cirrosporium novae-zelandiae]
MAASVFSFSVCLTLISYLISFANCLSTKATVLVIATDSTAAQDATLGLDGYGIPYQVLAVPQTGTTLPVLSDNSTSTGNFGAIVVLSQVSYDYTNGTTSGYASALTSSQWTTLYNYQIAYGVRMVQLNVYPSTDFGTSPLGGCCNTGVEQYISISNGTAFSAAGLKTWANMSSSGLWHYPATITNSSIATEFLQFAPNTQFTSNSTAGVINNIGGRQQMVFFTSFGMTWSATSNFLAHTWITWATRSTYTGYRRVYLGTQIDDVFLETDLYTPNGTTFRVRPSDLATHKTWTTTINGKMNKGSSYFVELGLNGNGNIENSDNSDTTGTRCSPGAIEYADQIDTPLEFQKPLGSGTNVWPTTPTVYGYSTTCVRADALETWLATTSNRDTFAFVSHTFTHLELNNATYSDAAKEIQFNQAWLNQTGFASATHFSSKGLIPPAITGLHNGDVLQAWHDNGLSNAVGDNTRPVLMNSQNGNWPYITTVAANGYDGYQVTPRWATAIYYNCDLPNCTYTEWVATSAGSGGFENLMAIEKTTNTRHLLSLSHAPYMFHQANLRQSDVSSTTVNGVSGQYSLLQIWVETIVQEMVRLVNWPIITLKHDDIATDFANRITRDACTPALSYTFSTSGSGSSTKPTAITGVTLSTNGNTCSATVPVTLPGPVTSTQGFTTEQLGSDPLTIWVKMSGSAVSFTLQTPIAI